MKQNNTHIMYGFITALALIIVGLVMHFAGLSFEKWAQWPSYGILFIGILLNANAFSKANDQYVTFGQTFASGFKASAIVTLVMIVWSFISLSIFPEIKEMAYEQARQNMLDQGMEADQIDQGMEMMDKLFNVFMIGGILFAFMIAGAISSLISAAIVKKKGHIPPHQMQ